MMTKTKIPLSGVKVHFVGIGGVGMSGLAELLHFAGRTVTGSDMAESPQIQRLRSLGITVFIGHAKNNIKKAEILVKSSAVPHNNVEIQQAKKQKIPVLERAEALSEVMRLKRGLVVAGTHGKTTTTHLLSHIFVHNKAHPTVALGGRSHLFQSTAFLGKGEWFIAESDESDGGFQKLSPEVALITNIDQDHIDHYGSFENLKSAFLQFALKTPFYGAVVACGDDPVLKAMLSSINRKVIFYGFKPHNHFVLKKVKPLKYQVFLHKKLLGVLPVPLYGAMNSLNTLGALATAMQVGFSFKECINSFRNFKELDRRFQWKGQAKGVDVYDDYAHHPTEVKAVLQAFREKFGLKKRRLLVLFQPHRFSRTLACWEGFLKCFKLADKIFLMDIYPASEKPLKGVTSQKMSQEIKKPNCVHCPGSLEKDVAHFVSQFLKPGDVVITMGAGSVYKYGPAILSYLKNS